MRAQGGWMGISLALLIFRFVVPLLALLPRSAKRNDNHVLLIATIVLIMQYVDIYWMVYPNFFDGQVTFGFWRLGSLLDLRGIFLLSIMSFWTKHSLVPLKDPRIHEAINHHVTYFKLGVGLLAVGILLLAKAFEQSSLHGRPPLTAFFIFLKSSDYYCRFFRALWNSVLPAAEFPLPASLGFGKNVLMKPFVWCWGRCFLEWDYLGFWGLGGG